MYRWLLFDGVTSTIEKDGMVLKMSADGCLNTDHEVMFLEHVQLKISLTYSRRGDLQLHLMSPTGTPSTLLPRRKDDYQPGKLDSWHFLSVFYWGERPNGTWTLIVENVGSELNAGLFSWPVPVAVSVMFLVIFWWIDLSENRHFVACNC